MTIFLWTMVACFVLSIFAKLYRLSKGDYTPSTPSNDVIDTLFNIGFLIWAIVLLQGS